MELVNYDLNIPDTEPKVRVYDNYVVLNAAAVALLGVGSGDYVQIRASRNERINGKPLLYVGRTGNIFGYVVRRRMNTMRINSRKLARSLQTSLDGCGCYLVSKDDVQIVDNEVTYNIFFRNYDKKDTD